MSKTVAVLEWAILISVAQLHAAEKQKIFPSNSQFFQVAGLRAFP